MDSYVTFLGEFRVHYNYNNEFLNNDFGDIIRGLRTMDGSIFFLDLIFGTFLKPPVLRKVEPKLRENIIQLIRIWPFKTFN